MTIALAIALPAAVLLFLIVRHHGILRRRRRLGIVALAGRVERAEELQSGEIALDVASGDDATCVVVADGVLERQRAPRVGDWISVEVTPVVRVVEEVLYRTSGRQDVLEAITLRRGRLPRPRALAIALAAVSAAVALAFVVGPSLANHQTTNVDYVARTRGSMVCSADARIVTTKCTTKCVDGLVGIGWTHACVLRSGARHGVARSYSADGTLREETEYVRGHKSGTFRRWSGEGHLVEAGHLRAGRRHGRWFRWAPDGGEAVEVEDFRVGKRHGLWLRRTGTFRAAGQYRFGERVGVWRMHGSACDPSVVEERPLEQSCSYKDGQLHGRVYTSLTKGRWISGRYVDGRRHGRWATYKGRKLLSVEIWLHGEREPSIRG